MAERVMTCPDKCQGSLADDKYSFHGIAVAEEQVVMDLHGQWNDTLDTETVEWPGEGDDIRCAACGEPAAWIDYKRPETPVAERPHPGRRHG